MSNKTFEPTLHSPSGCHNVRPPLPSLRALIYHIWRCVFCLAEPKLMLRFLPLLPARMSRLVASLLGDDRTARCWRVVCGRSILFHLLYNDLVRDVALKMFSRCYNHPSSKRDLLNHLFFFPCNTELIHSFCLQIFSKLSSPTVISIIMSGGGSSSSSSSGGKKKPRKTKLTRCWDCVRSS